MKKKITKKTLKDLDKRIAEAKDLPDGNKKQLQ